MVAEKRLPDGFSTIACKKKKLQEKYWRACRDGSLSFCTIYADDVQFRLVFIFIAIISMCTSLKSTWSSRSPGVIKPCVFCLNCNKTSCREGSWAIAGFGTENEKGWLIPWDWRRSALWGALDVLQLGAEKKEDYQGSEEAEEHWEEKISTSVCVLLRNMVESLLTWPFYVGIGCWPQWLLLPLTALHFRVCYIISLWLNRSNIH